MPRRPDKVRVEIIQDSDGQTIGLSFDRFTSLSVVNDITAPSEASFELGDDGTWKGLERMVSPGAQFRVFINDRVYITGRVEMTDVPADASSGAVVRFVVRTKMSDAAYAAADHNVKVKGVSVRDFVLKLYEPLGYKAADFIFDPGTARDLITGKISQGGQPQVPLDPLKEEQAKVQPGESIKECADRHLRRHGFMHWDSPDGRIVVGAPWDAQDPTYFFRMMRGKNGRENNLLSASRIRDYSQSPSILGVFGVGGKSDFTKAKVQFHAIDADVINRGFYRPVVIVAEGIKTQKHAEHAARREQSARNRRKDAFDLEFDGLSWWDGYRNIGLNTDTTCDIRSDVAGGPLGTYYVHRVERRRDTSSGDMSRLTVVRKGLWVL